MIGYYKISRPTTCFFTILITILGYTISLQKNLDDTKSRNIAPLMLTVCVNVCNIAATNTINDVFDYYSDKINIPSRPLPMGLISNKKASIFCFILYLTSIILSYFFSYRATKGYSFDSQASTVMIWQGPLVASFNNN